MKPEMDDNCKTVCVELGGLFERSRQALHLVGGAVRDLLLGRGGHDFDFTTSAPPNAIRRIVRSTAAACFDRSRAKGYGTQGVKLHNGIEVEITPYRETVAGGPGPATLASDLCGRDFTVNAMAMDVCPSQFGAITDPCGGAADLAAHILRTPAPPELSFTDDPLRLLRAARFATGLCLRIESETLNTIRALAAQRPCPLETVSPERVRDELLYMMSLPQPSSEIDLLRDLGLLAVVLPEVQALADMTPEPGTHHKNAFRHTLRVVDVAAATAVPDDPVLVFAALLHDIGKPTSRRLENGDYTFHEHEKTGADLAAAACERLRFSNAQASRVTSLVRLHHRLYHYAPDWTDAAVRRAVHELGALFDDALLLAQADLTTADPDKRARVRRDLEEFSARAQALDRASALKPVPPIDGIEIMRLLGLSTGGPEVGRAVQLLKDRIIDGALDPKDADAAREIIRAHFSDKP